MNEINRKLAVRLEVIRLSKEGHSEREISKKVKFLKSTVHYILKKYKKFHTITRIKGSGRKKLLVEEDLKILNNIVENSPMISAKKISIELSERIGKQVSVSTIHNE